MRINKLVYKLDEYWFDELLPNESVKKLNDNQRKIVQENYSDKSGKGWLGFYQKDNKFWKFLKNGKKIIVVNETDGYTARQYLNEYFNLNNKCNCNNCNCKK